MSINIHELKHHPNFTRFVSELNEYGKMGGKMTHIFPKLDDYYDSAGTMSGHYFHQDLLVSQFIYLNKPSRHIDIGSRIDGFVAHVAAFREIEILDIRHMPKSIHENIKFTKIDLMIESDESKNIADSISCLHTLEHFGLGRYSDKLDPQGHILGFNNIINMLKSGGTLYVSIPIGKANEIHFNAHRIFHPNDILNWSNDAKSLSIKRFDYIDDAGDLHKNVNIENFNLELVYGCGIYTFIKN